MNNTSALRAGAMASSMVSVSPNCYCNCNCSSTTMMHMRKTTKMPLSVAMKSKFVRGVRCEVAINAVEESTTSAEAKVGARVKVKEGVKVYHVPKVPELDLTGMEGEIKQYVGLWNVQSMASSNSFVRLLLQDLDALFALGRCLATECLSTIGEISVSFANPSLTFTNNNTTITLLGQPSSTHTH